MFVKRLREIRLFLFARSRNMSKNIPRHIVLKLSCPNTSYQILNNDDNAPIRLRMILHTFRQVGLVQVLLWLGTEICGTSELDHLNLFHLIIVKAKAAFQLFLLGLVGCMQLQLTGQFQRLQYYPTKSN